MTTRQDGRLRVTCSIDAVSFDDAGRITRLEGYWGPEDVEVVDPEVQSPKRSQ